MHRRRRARRYTRGILALVTPGDLKRPAHIREVACIYVLHVGPRHRQRDLVLGFTGSRAGMAPDASGVVDDLRPNRLCLDVGYSGRHTAGVVSVSRSIYQKYHSVAEERPKSLPNQVVH